LCHVTSFYLVYLLVTCSESYWHYEGDAFEAVIVLI
jgi:hypothetical protein